MDFDTEAADDFYRAVKSWEHILPGYLNCAGADSDDSESDNGLLTPPPDCENTFEKAWILPPPRPTYADSWIRVMKRRVGEVDNFSSEHDSDSDVSSISSLSADSYPAAYVAYDTPTDAHGYHCPGSEVSGGLVFSDGSSDGEYKEGSTATAADAEDLFAEMLNTYTVPKSLKSVITGASQQKRKASSRSQSRGKPSGISKRSLRSSPRTSPRGRSFKT